MKISFLATETGGARVYCSGDQQTTGTFVMKFLELSKMAALGALIFVALILT
ncbi:hypothetical protein ACXYMO_11820 [Arenibacterium sp. CAU 1754]